MQLHPLGDIMAVLNVGCGELEKRGGRSSRAHDQSVARLHL
jgi:hypothetical protein